MKNFTKENIISLEGDELHRYQQCLFEMAKDFAQICDKFDLIYSLNGGSVLGAVRHGGFIPWDDDIDFSITRKSYNKLLTIFNQELGDKYYIQTPMNHPELGLMVTQIRKKRTVARRKYDWKLPRDECGISIDLYIIENVFNNPIKRNFQGLMSTFCSYAISSIRACNNKNIPKQLIEMENRNFNYGKSKMVFGKLFGIISLNKWVKWCDYWNSLCKDDTSRLVVIPTGVRHYFGELFERSEICVFTKAKFESKRFNIPICFDKYLTYFYGNYMVLPPENKKEKHLFLELEF